MTNNMSMGLKQWIMLFTLSVLWGGSFFFMKIALNELPTMTIVFLRVSIAALSLFLYLAVIGQLSKQKQQVWKLFLYLALLNNIIPFSLIIFGMNQLASGVASILNATTPLFTIIVAHMATQDEKITSNKCIGIILGIIGVAILIGFEMLEGLGDHLIAILACLGAGLSYAFASVAGRQFKKYSVAPTSIAFGQLFVSSMILFPIILFVDRPWNLAIPSSLTISSVIALGILSSAVAYVLFFKLISQAGATNAVMVTLLVPVSAMALGVVFLNEVLSINHFLGMGFIAMGLLIIDGRIIKYIGLNR